MVRGSTGPWAEMLAAGSAGPAGLRSSSRLNVLGQSSVAVINLSITSYHPACQTPPPPGPSPAPRAPGKEKARQNRVREQLGPHPLLASGPGWLQGFCSFPAGCTQERSEREILPARSWQAAHRAPKQRVPPRLAF